MDDTVSMRTQWRARMNSSLLPGSRSLEVSTPQPSTWGLEASFPQLPLAVWTLWDMWPKGQDSAHYRLKHRGLCQVLSDPVCQTGNLLSCRVWDLLAPGPKDYQCFAFLSGEKLEIQYPCLHLAGCPRNPRGPGPPKTVRIRPPISQAPPLPCDAHVHGASRLGANPSSPGPIGIFSPE